jgi:hypothetical protein
MSILSGNKKLGESAAAAAGRISERKRRDETIKMACARNARTASIAGPESIPEIEGERDCADRENADFSHADSLPYLRKV